MFILSIVIATHNREDYAIKAIKSILNIPSGNIQLVVHDTSDSTKLKNHVSNINDCRLKYYYCNEALSMTENYNRAVTLSDGKFVTLIGDDDTVLDSILIAVEYAEKNNIDIIAPYIYAHYYWPDYKTKFSDNLYAGKLRIASFKNKASIIHSKDALDRAFEQCFQGTINLPKLYHGIVKKTLLNKIKKITGNYFHGVSPDISIAVSLAYCSLNYTLIDYPLTLPGSSGKSNAGRSAMRTHVGNLESDPHMVRFKSYKWDDTLPKFFSVETVWAQAGLETIDKLTSDIDNFNYIKFYALCLVNHISYYNEIFYSYNSYKSKNKVNPVIIFFQLIGYISYFSFKKTLSIIKKIYLRLNKSKDDNSVVEFNAKDIVEAKDIADEYLRKIPQHFLSK